MDKIKIKFFFEPRLLDHIGLAMYSNVPKALSELVANSYDADASEVRLTYPRKITPRSKIIIKDDGAGMDEEAIRNIYMHLGINIRERRKKTAKYRRLPIGSKGLGKIAGLGIANKMTVETVKEKIKYKFVLDRVEIHDAGGDLGDMEFDLGKEEVSVPNGTNVILEDLLPHTVGIAVDEIKKFLKEEFEISSNFNIFVNRQKVSPVDIPGRTLKINETIEPYGKVTGKITIADAPRYVKKQGIITYVRKRAVIGPTIFDINAGGHTYRVANRIIGEINVDFLDPIEPEDTLDEFIIATSRDNFAQNNAKFLAYKKWAEEKLKKIAIGLEKEQAKARKEKLLKDKKVQKLLKGLAPEIKNRVLDLIERIVPKVSELRDEDAEVILTIIVKAAESNAILDILRGIEKSRVEDIEKLASLINEWGVYEVSAISELINRRLQVLDKFETLVKNIDTLEFPTIHKLVENNVWLLSEDYRLYTSNKTLKTAFDGYLDKKFKKRLRDRPDLICNSLQNRFIIIELKRPKETVDEEAFAQLKRYKTIVRQYNPSWRSIDCFLIGNKFDEAVRDPEDEKIGIFLKSFGEIIEDARERYLEYIKVVNLDSE